MDESRKRCLSNMADRAELSPVIRGPTYAIFGGPPPYDHVANVDIRRFMPPFNASAVQLPHSLSTQRDVGDVPAYDYGMASGSRAFSEFMGPEQSLEILGAEASALNPGDCAAFHEILAALAGTDLFSNYRKTYPPSYVPPGGNGGRYYGTDALDMHVSD